MTRKWALPVLMVVVLVMSGCSFLASAPTPKARTTRFVKAIQAQDYQKLVDSTYYYQVELDHIRASNPKNLTKKLVDDYVAAKRRLLEDEASIESVLMTGLRTGAQWLGATVSTDPAADIQTLMGLLPPKATWTITEHKSKTANDPLTQESRPVHEVYVTVRYPSAEIAPQIGEQKLKETVIALVLDEKTGLFIEGRRLSAGDVYW